MNNQLVKALVALIAGIVVASFVGIAPAFYLWAVALSLIFAFVVGAVPMILLVLCDVDNDRVGTIAVILAQAVALAVDYKLGFTLHQVVVLAVSLALFQVALELLFPTR
jgi:hypothetical protein